MTSESLLQGQKLRSVNTLNARHLQHGIPNVSRSALTFKSKALESDTLSSNPDWGAVVGSVPFFLHFPICRRAWVEVGTLLHGEEWEHTVAQESCFPQ